MPVKDPQIIRLIEQLGDHYRTNISNRFLRPFFLNMSLDKQSWDLVESLTKKVEDYQYQGYHLDELYRQLVAAARFVSMTRRELLPGLRARVGAATSAADRVLRDMAIHNFSPNILLFADLLNELYIKLVELDKNEARGKRPVYLSIPELQDFGRLLIGT